MHGYHPTDPQSYAALLTNQPNIPEEVAAIPHVFNLMTRDAEEANRENAKPKQQPQTNRRLVEEVS
jgi:hypothetical protein